MLYLVPEIMTLEVFVLKISATGGLTSPATATESSINRRQIHTCRFCLPFLDI